MRLAILLCSTLLLACGGGGSSSDTPEQPSGGCSNWTLPRGVTTGNISVAGVTRTYVLDVPASSSGAIPVVFAFHGLGGDGKGLRSWFVGMSFESAAKGPTIFVYPDGIVGSSGDEDWSDVGGRDVAFFDALLARIEAQACVDEGRVFATGFSYGGYMSNNLGAKRAAVLRAIAPLSGGGGGGSSGKIAVWAAAGADDPYLDGCISSVKRWAQVNGCSTTTTATSPSPCVAYTGCASGYPVVWCQFNGDHTVQPWEAPAVMRFFDGLP